MAANWTVEFIEAAIRKAEAGRSKLAGGALDVTGYTSPKIRHLLNNLGELPGAHHLEVGVHEGATFVATNFRNRMSSSVAVDNWSEFAQNGKSRERFIGNAGKFLTPGSYRFYEQDCFAVTKEQLPDPVDFFLYDGSHGYESHLKALTHFCPLLDDVFLFLVDDWGWPDTRKGTRQAVQELGLKTLFEAELGQDQGWWNGFFVSLLAKNPEGKP